MRALVPVMVALALSGCTAGGALRPPERAAPVEEFAMPETPQDAVAPRHAEVAGAAGPLALSIWSPQAPPKAVILALHGFGDYGPSTYDAAARAWAERGILTWAYDQRGFGRNPSRGFWPGAGALAADLRVVAAAVRAAHPCVPLVVVGHSMGAGVALAAAPGLRAEGLVLAAPAIWGGE
ncbi:MAG: alpha/beta fold hydrolase, partial [Pseudomonadota bacterium]